MTDPQLKDDIKFLLSFAPALSPTQVSPGLGGMFYITNSYEGDVALAEKVEAIRNRYGIEIHDVADLDEDEVNI